MKNKLGIIGGLILSLFIASSVALADTGKANSKSTKSPAVAAMAKTKTVKPKKHHKHRKQRKHRIVKKTMNKSETKTPKK